MQRAVFIIGSLFVLGCSVLNPKKGGSSGGGGSGSGDGPTPQVGKGWAETLVEAPVVKLGQPVEVKAPPCSGNGFLELEIEQDKPFHFSTTSPTGGNSCAYVEVVNGNGSSANTSMSSLEVCGETKTIESKGQPGGTYIVVSEKYGCAGITVSLAIKDGPAGAAPAPTAAPTADGPKPENTDGPKPEN
jgi:hypothetical protein